MNKCTDTLIWNLLLLTYTDNTYTDAPTHPHAPPSQHHAYTLYINPFMHPSL